MSVGISSRSKNKSHLICNLVEKSKSVIEIMAGLSPIKWGTINFKRTSLTSLIVSSIYHRKSSKFPSPKSKLLQTTKKTKG